MRERISAFGRVASASEGRDKMRSTSCRCARAVRTIHPKKLTGFLKYEIRCSWPYYWTRHWCS
jgi:hypothetical protein